MPGSSAMRSPDAGEGADTDEGGRGLWLAHQLADLVQIRRSPAGMTVRVHAWLS